MSYKVPKNRSNDWMNFLESFCLIVIYDTPKYISPPLGYTFESSVVSSIRRLSSSKPKLISFCADVMPLFWRLLMNPCSCSSATTASVSEQAHSNPNMENKRLPTSASNNEKPSTRDVMESLKIIVGYIDARVNGESGVASIESVLMEVIAEELRGILKQSITLAQSPTAARSINSTTSNDKDVSQSQEVRDLREELRRKDEHIEVLEQVIHELQTSLRVEVDKPTLVKLKDKLRDKDRSSNSGCTTSLSDLTSSRDSFEDEAAQSQQQEQTDSERLSRSEKSPSRFSLFGGRRSATPTKDNTSKETSNRESSNKEATNSKSALTVTVDERSPLSDQGGAVAPVVSSEFGSSAAKRRLSKRLIHFTPASAPESKSSSPRPTHALNDFLDY